MLRLYNTLTRTKEAFRPLDPANVRVYVCGPTVYDFAHIGNARPVIVFDVLYRLLRHIYGPDHVTYVRNITDVDDKINARAGQDYPDLKLNDAIRKVTEKTEAQFHADMAALGALDPSVEPRATEHIEQMKAMIEALVTNGCAYVAEDHVLFQVAAMADYGKLSGRSLDEMIAGARVEVAPYKKDPMDFVLWKPSKPGEPSWASPAGIKTPGRPGWHIECSAMAKAHLGETFDIHGGGIDLVFPHHENEIAQSRCANRTPIMAQLWMHNGFLQVEGEKMAKSAGNFVTVHELLEEPVPGLVPIADEEGPITVAADWKVRWNGLCVRYAMLQTHYREPIDWTARRFKEAGDELYRFYKILRGAHYDVSFPNRPLPDKLLTSLLDDLNTPAAITELRAAAKSQSISALGAGLSFLGLLDGEFVTRDLTLFDRALSLTSQQKIDVTELVDARNAARAAKDFKEADRIRGELEAMGIVLKDAKDPNTGELTTSWEVAR